MEKETKDRVVSISVALLITAIFAVPYFYYEYFYNVTPVQMAEKSESHNMLANIIDPIKSAGENLKEFFKGDFLRESVYINE
jgi:hypothetical protein